MQKKKPNQEKKYNRITIHVKERPAGTFSLVSNTILYNKNLTHFDKLLLISILSDDDTYIFNVMTYANRFGCSDDTIGNSIKRLKKAGYIIQTQVDKRFNVWTYKISEYGNLNNESKETPELKAPAVENTCDLSEQIASTEHISDPIHDSTLTVESDVKPIDLKDYANLIFDEIDKSIMNDKEVDIANCIEYFKTAIANGTLESADQLTVENINLIIERFFINEPVQVAPSRITETECVKIIENKMTGGTVNQRKDTHKKVLQWFIDEQRNKTHDEIEAQTFKTHHNSKTAGRVIDQKYND
jgi:biotin operon repressor